MKGPRKGVGGGGGDRGSEPRKVEGRGCKQEWEGGGG